MFKTIRNFILRIAVSALSLGLVWYMTRGKILDSLYHLKNVDLWIFSLAILLNFISILPVTFRVGTVLSIQGIHLSFARRYYLWVMSLFFNLFLPSAVGGDIVRAYYIYKDSGKKMASVTSILIDRFFGLMASVTIGAAAFWVARKHLDDPQMGQVLFWFVVLIFIGVLFLMSRQFSKPAKSLLFWVTPKRLKEHLERLFSVLDLYQTRRKAFLISFAYSLLAQVLFILMVYFLALSIHIHLPLALYFLYMPLVTVFSMIPSVGGLGVREAAFVHLFGHYIPVDQAVALSLIFDVFIYGIGIACGILYAIRGGASIMEIEEMEEAQLEREKQ